MGDKDPLLTVFSADTLCATKVINPLNSALPFLFFLSSSFFLSLLRRKVETKAGKLFKTVFEQEE
jgi:hypothetical protein